MPGADNTSLDFDALRSRAIATLQRVAGRSWTDHNSHDPGITLLEQLCYALSDLGYRSAYPVSDLLASLPGGTGLYGPAQLLPGGPVSADDLRRLVVDLPGVRNAWVEPVDEALARHDGAQALIAAVSAGAGLDSASPNVTELRPRGLCRVLIEKSGQGEDIEGGALLRQAAIRLQQWRGLGEDVAEIVVLDQQAVALGGAVELAAGADAAETSAAVLEAVAAYVSPPLPFRSLREMLARGWRVDQIFEGPLLQRGFLDPVEWAAAGRRSTLRVSDLIQVIMAVPGVAAVKRLGFLRDGLPSSDWLLPISPDRCAGFDIPGSRLQFERGGLRVDHPALRAQARRLFDARRRRTAQAPAVPDDALAPPPGRPRDPGRYLSVMHQLPQVYGVGPAGLSGQEPAERHALARQLKAYLLIFDQLLANQFAQLAQAARLLSFTDDGAQTVFSQPVADDGGVLQLDQVRQAPAAAHAPWLARISADPWDDPAAADAALAQRHRLADHLLARLGERWGEHRPLPAAGDDVDELDPAQHAPRLRALRDKQAFLHDYPTLAARRGAGADMLAGDDGPADGNGGAAAAQAGLPQRLSRRLGLGESASAPLLVEHVLLRPLPGDAHQRGPMLRAAASADPFSLQLSLVLANQDPAWADADLRQRLAIGVADEAPAHLLVRLLWLDDAALAAFGAAWRRWRGLWREALRQRHGLADGAAADGHQIPLRSARNRVIDALGLGDTLPLTDLVIADGNPGGGIKVAHGSTAQIAIDDAEAGVRYELRGPEGVPLRDARGQALPPVWADGQDGRLLLESPPITDDISFRILATKLAPFGSLAPQPPVLLTQPAAVRVGLDTGLLIELPGLPLLDATLANPLPGDVRRCRHGDALRVLVHGSQEGVAYALEINGQPQAGSVTGDLATVALRSPPLHEDTLIAVRATKRFADSADRSEVSELLDARLRVAVTADPTPALRPLPGAVLDFGDGAAGLLLLASQASAGYRLWQRRVRDAEWQRDGALPGALTAGDGLLQVAAPAWAEDGSPPEGFVAVGDAPVAGNGGDLVLPLGAPAADVVCLVQAIKRHDAGGGNFVETVVGLAQACLLLVRPDPRPALRLTLLQPLQGPLELRFQGGQPGVAYAVQPLPDGKPLPLMAYFHQRDDTDAGQNKGVSQLGIGIDLVVAGDGDDNTPDAALGQLLRRAQRAPAAPLLLLPPLATDQALALQALKRQTGIEQPLALGVRLMALPKARVEPAWGVPGEGAVVQLSRAAAGERYQLWSQGQALGAPVAGDGGALALETGPCWADAVLVLRVETDADDSMPLARERQLALRLLPRADLGFAAARAELAAGEATEIVLDSSQAGVTYQLLAERAGGGLAQAVGDPVTGQGGALALVTDAVEADTRFTVRASRSDDAAGTVLLAGEAWVRLQAAAPAAAPA